MRWAGVFPSVVTPFGADGGIDFAAFERHLRMLVDAGVHGLIVASTLGECIALDQAEKRELVARAAALAAPRGVPVVAAVVGLSAHGERRYVAGLRDAGAAAMLVFPPVLYRATRGELVAHLRAVLAETDLPALVFNKPGAFGCDFSPEAAEALAHEPRWAGVKEAAELTSRIPAWRRAFGERAAVFCGDELALEALALGADGVVAGLGNVVPGELARFFRAHAAGDAAGAAALYRWLAPLLELDVSPRLVQNIKLAASLALGLPEHVRAPRQPLAGAEREAVAALVARALATRPAGP